MSDNVQTDAHLILVKLGTFDFGRKGFIPRVRNFEVNVVQVLFDDFEALSFGVNLYRTLVSDIFELGGEDRLIDCSRHQNDLDILVFVYQMLDQ
jgi:hypothetical protein